MAVLEDLAPPAADEWQKGKTGKEYVSARGRSGVIYRQGTESVQEALDRDAAGPRDTRPKPKPRVPKPPPPASKSLKEVEKALADGLRAPGMVCTMFGDEWAANHFYTAGPGLARQLVAAAEHNPWLREKLEAAASGEDFAVKLMAMLGLTGAVIAYAGPPIIYFANLNVPPQAREMMQIPIRQQHRKPGPNAATASTAQPAPEPPGPVVA